MTNENAGSIERSSEGAGGIVYVVQSADYKTIRHLNHGLRCSCHVQQGAGDRVVLWVEASLRLNRTAKLIVHRCLDGNGRAIVWGPLETSYLIVTATAEL